MGVLRGIYGGIKSKIKVSLRQTQPMEQTHVLIEHNHEQGTDLLPEVPE